MYAFEPVSFHYNELLRNSNANHLTHVFACQYIISANNDSVKIFLSGEDNTGLSSLTVPENFSGKTEECKSITLDDFISAYPDIIPSVIKIDIEGAEMKALTGMNKTIDKYTPLFIIEIIDEHLSRFSDTKEMIFNFMKRKGYCAYHILNNGCVTKLLNPAEGYGILFVPETYSFPAEISVIS